jgi:FMN phosphatase YigB (HAD superfamily)
MERIEAVIFDWGDTVMQDFPEYKGPMVYWPRVKVVDGVVEALKSIRPEIICCLASNAGDSDAVLMGLALERANIRPYFHYLFTSKELGVKKPDPGFYKVILEKIKLKPQQCIAVGNNYHNDIAPAGKIGIKTIWLSDAKDKDSAKTPEVIIGSMQELPSAIKKIHQLRDGS